MSTFASLIGDIFESLLPTVAFAEDEEVSKNNILHRYKPDITPLTTFS